MTASSSVPAWAKPHAVHAPAPSDPEPGPTETTTEDAIEGADPGPETGAATTEGPPATDTPAPAKRTRKAAAAEKIATGELPVIFDPESGRALLRLLFSVISGGAIYRKSSYLLDREGTAVASPLVSRARIARRVGSARAASVTLS